MLFFRRKTKDLKILMREKFHAKDKSNKRTIAYTYIERPLSKHHTIKFFT